MALNQMVTLLILLLALLPQPPVAVVVDHAESEAIGDPDDQQLARRTDWLGLYRRGQQWRLEPVRVQIQTRTDLGLKLYRFVTTPSQPTMLISRVPRLSPGPVKVAGTAIALGTERRSASLSFAGLAYTLAYESRAADACDATVTLSLGGTRQVLYSPETAGRTADPELTLSCDGPHFEVLWAGDLDRDGRLDLLVTFSPKYSYYPQRLWLSSAAASGGLVGDVALYESSAA